MKQFAASDVAINVVNDSQDPTERAVELTITHRDKLRVRSTVEFFRNSERRDPVIDPFLYVHMFVEAFDRFGYAILAIDVNVDDLSGTYEDDDDYDFDGAVKRAIDTLLPIANLIVHPDEEIVITVSADTVIEHVESKLGIELTPEQTAWLEANVSLDVVAESFDNDSMAYECGDDLDDGMSDYLADFRKAFGISKDDEEDEDYDDDDPDDNGGLDLNAIIDEDFG